MADITAKVKVIDQTTLELISEAKPGDRIDLKALSQVDVSYVANLLDSKKDQAIEKRIQENSKNLEIQKNNEIEKIKSDFNNQIANLRRDLEDAKKDKDLAIKDVETKDREEYGKLKERYTSLEANLELKIEAERAKIEQQYMAQLNDKNAKLMEKDLSLQTALAQKEAELRKEFGLEKDKLQSELSETKDKLSRLNLEKSNLNVKKLGEDLEQWCLQEYRNYEAAGAFAHCVFEKANTVMKDSESDGRGTKPDFLFTMYADDGHEGKPLASVCLEMKNESNTSTNRKKNADYYQRLEENRRKNNMEYALLVSELEWSSANDAPIVKVPEYEKMYMVRPQYLITFLAIIYNLGLKYRDLLAMKSQEETKFKESRELIEEFEQMRRTYIDEPLENMKDKIDEIEKQADVVVKAGEKIKSACAKIIDSSIKRMQNKVEKFDIRKIADKISQI